jgi:hypothetical protein
MQMPAATYGQPAQGGDASAPAYYTG